MAETQFGTAVEALGHGGTQQPDGCQGGEPRRTELDEDQRATIRQQLGSKLGKFTRYIERVTVRVRLRPMGFDVLRDFVASGDLDEAVIDAMPTYDLASTVLEWDASTSPPCIP